MWYVLRVGAGSLGATVGRRIQAGYLEVTRTRVQQNWFGPSGIGCSTERGGVGRVSSFKIQSFRVLCTLDMSGWRLGERIETLENSRPR